VLLCAFIVTGEIHKIISKVIIFIIKFLIIYPHSLIICFGSHVIALTKLLLKVKNKKRGGVLFTLMPI